MGRRKKRVGDPKRAVGYARVSTDDQKLGVAGQTLVLEEWCQANDVELLEVFADQGVSGSKEVHARPVMLEAIDACRDRDAGILLVAKRDRIARDPKIAWDAEERLGRVGARILSADGIGNQEGPEGEFLRGIFDSVAKLEREHTRANTTRALRAKKKKGLRHNNTAPYGYAWDKADAIVKVDDEQGALRALRRWRRQGKSYHRCCELLEKRGHPPRGAQWHYTTVRRICEREGISKG